MPILKAIGKTVLEGDEHECISFVLGLVLGSSSVHTDNSTLDAAIGGGLGGAAGAAIGNELGGVTVQSSAAPSAVGLAAVTTGAYSPKKSSSHRETVEYHRYPESEPSYHFCPPGQAKKGRC